MPSLLVRTNLSRGDLRIFLSNENGYAADAASVRWTVYDPQGRRVSGESIRAIRAAVGEYYAPWFSDVRNGNYTLRWEVQDTDFSAVRTLDLPLFVVDPSSYGPAGAVQSGGMPFPGGLAYLSGTVLGPGDLPLYLRNSDGVLQDALAVFWTICDAAGNPVSPRTPGYRIGVGTYYAPWSVSAGSGNYTVLWEYVADADSPMQSARMGFSVINPQSPVVNQIVQGDCRAVDDMPTCNVTTIPTVLMGCTQAVSASCSSFAGAPCFTPGVAVPPAPPVNVCCDERVEIPRVVHLPSGALPASGAFTSQPAFNIPGGIRHVAFYITYTRGADGGHALFKLMWGNGVEESQETIVDDDIDGPTIMGQQGMFLQDLTGPTPDDGNPVSFVLYVSVPGGAKTVRLLASEAGVPGIPGTVGITLTASSN